MVIPPMDFGKRQGCIISCGRLTRKDRRLEKKMASRIGYIVHLIAFGAPMGNGKACRT